MAREWLSEFEHWPIALLMIVIASWALYRFIAPRSWREWRGAGLVQAFIIALYAEMYGFPLTLYLLTSLFPIDIPIAHASGHLWATLLGYGDTGDAIEMLLGFAFIGPGILLIAIGWLQVYRASSKNRLVTDGAYGVVRHPQYAGIILIIFGQLVHWPTIPTLILGPVIVWAYVALARREEKQLLKLFGAAYKDYQRRVPMFVPRLSTQDWQQDLRASQ